MLLISAYLNMDVTVGTWSRKSGRRNPSSGVPLFKIFCSSMVINIPVKVVYAFLPVSPTSAAA